MNFVHDLLGVFASLGDVLLSEIWQQSVDPIVIWIKTGSCGDL